MASWAIRFNKKKIFSSKGALTVQLKACFFLKYVSNRKTITSDNLELASKRWLFLLHNYRQLGGLVTKLAPLVSMENKTVLLYPCDREASFRFVNG